MASAATGGRPPARGDRRLPAASRRAGRGCRPARRSACAPASGSAAAICSTSCSCRWMSTGANTSSSWMACSSSSYFVLALLLRRRRRTACGERAVERQPVGAPLGQVEEFFGGRHLGTYCGLRSPVFGLQSWRCGTAVPLGSATGSHCGTGDRRPETDHASYERAACLAARSEAACSAASRTRTPHLRMRRLQVHVDALAAQFLGCRGPDRATTTVRPSAARTRVGRGHPVGHLQQVHDLRAGREQHHVDLAGGQRAAGVLQRARGPPAAPTDRPARASRRRHAPRAPPASSAFDVPYSCTATRRPASGRLGLRRRWPPAARARCWAPRPRPTASGPARAGRASGLGPRTASCTRPSAATKASRCRWDALDDVQQHARADAGQQHDDVELAPDERVGKRDGGGVRFERHLPHRRRHARAARRAW